jgi:hypothetical protein
MTERVDVLLPTVDRAGALAVALAGLVGQARVSRVVVADQSTRPSWSSPEVAGVIRVIRHRGVEVELHHRPSRRGVAEQLDFLLGRTVAPVALVLGDDVLLEAGAVDRMTRRCARSAPGSSGWR